ncbi:Mut7-C RNAse domain-containing protein [Chloroflexota bacterium]
MGKLVKYEARVAGYYRWLKAVKLINAPKFIVDNNVGKLAKWLRIMGYDALFFKDGNDSYMIAIALAEGRVILTRDTQIVKRRVVTRGQLKVILIQSDKSELQMQQVIDTLNIDCQFRPFTICLECNQSLLDRSKQQVKDLVPPYVFQTQHKYMECPACHRIYWRGTHWHAMIQYLEHYMTNCLDSPVG